MIYPVKPLPGILTLGLVIILGLAVQLNAIARQNAGGVLHGTLSGENKSWTILEKNGRSTATFIEIAPDLWRFSIQGNVGEKLTIKDSLSMTFTVIGDTVQPATVSFFPKSAMTPVYTVQGSMELELEHLQVEGDSARIAGRFHDHLPYQDTQDTDPDTSMAIELDVEFDITAVRKEAD